MAGLPPHPLLAAASPQEAPAQDIPISLNQLGFEPGDPKTAIVEADGAPAGMTSSAPSAWCSSGSPNSARPRW